MLALVALTVCGLIAGSFGADLPKSLEIEVKKLKEICANRYVPIDDVKDVQLFIKILNRAPKLCPKKFLQSFMELDPILTLEKHHRLCDEDKFQLIAAYHFRYIMPKVETYSSGDDLTALGHEIVSQPLKVHLQNFGVQVDQYNNVIMIPNSLQIFFKAWALQVSGLCKKTLMENLNRAVQENMDKSDIAMINAFIATSKEGVVDPVSGEKINDLNFSGIVYMPDLEGNTRPELDALREETIKLDLKKDPEVERFFHACKLRFRPVYMKLILPVVRLAKLGYDYMGPKLDKAYGTIQDDPLVNAWAAVTAICELRGTIEIMESDPPADMQQLKYSPAINFVLADKLWIKNQNELETELERIEGSRSTGIKKALYLAGVHGNKLIHLLDPHRSAWFRRNRATVGIAVGSLNLISGITSLAIHFTG